MLMCEMVVGYKSRNWWNKRGSCGYKFGQSNEKGNRELIVGKISLALALLFHKITQ
jgi:hypothetical protein